jgi:hypothetical protein
MKKLKQLLAKGISVYFNNEGDHTHIRAMKETTKTRWHGTVKAKDLDTELEAQMELCDQNIQEAEEKLRKPKKEAEV